MSKSNPFSSNKAIANKKPTSVVPSGIQSTQSSRSGSSVKPEGLTRDSSGIGRQSSPIQFGKPSSNKAAASSSSSGSQWSKLLSQTASSGVSSALSGSFGLSSIGGIGSIISGIAGLFSSSKSSKAALPPLTQFSLPAQVVKTAYVSSSGISIRDGASAQLPDLPSTNSGIYGAKQSTSSITSNDWIQSQSTQIAQAVKTALLNSSTLNDVIAEI